MLSRALSTRQKIVLFKFKKLLFPLKKQQSAGVQIFIPICTASDKQSNRHQQLQPTRIDSFFSQGNFTLQRFNNFFKLCNALAGILKSSAKFIFILFTFTFSISATANFDGRLNAPHFCLFIMSINNELTSEIIELSRRGFEPLRVCQSFSSDETSFKLLR